MERPSWMGRGVRCAGEGPIVGERRMVGGLPGAVVPPPPPLPRPPPPRPPSPLESCRFSVNSKAWGRPCPRRSRRCPPSGCPRMVFFPPRPRLLPLPRVVVVVTAVSHRVFLRPRPRSSMSRCVPEKGCPPLPFGSQSPPLRPVRPRNSSCP